VTNQCCRTCCHDSDDVHQRTSGQSLHSAANTPFFLRNCWIVV
jgi:hypothetical protein